MSGLLLLFERTVNVFSEGYSNFKLMIIIKSPPEPMLLALKYKILRIQSNSIPRNEVISTISISCATALANSFYPDGAYLGIYSYH